jgi:hypothetical protein
MNLFNLTTNYVRLIELTNELDEQTFLDTLESIEEPLHTKMVNVVKVIRHIESDIEFIAKEEKRLAELKKSKNNSIKRLKDMLKFSVEVVGDETEKGTKKLMIKDDAFVKMIYTQNNPPSVDILDETKIPRKYRIKQADKIDNKAIIAAWKEQKWKSKSATITQSVGIRFK